MKIQTAGKASSTPRTEGTSAFVRPASHVPWWRRAGREHLAVAALLVVATVVRLALAARGWPQLDSDEGIVGLMVSDVAALRHFPVFFYGQQYMGATLAYLGVPAFLLFGPTTFALRATITVEIVAFLLVLYLFTRTVYSRTVALCTLALLALGPAPALYHEFYARTGNQTTLLCGALLLWLTVLRLQQGASQTAQSSEQQENPGRSRRIMRWLDVGIGLTAGIALWVDILILPFLAAAGIALWVDAVRRRRARASQATPHVLRNQILITGAACVAGMAPLIVASIKTQGRPIHQMLVTGGAPGFASGTQSLSLVDHLRLLLLQLLSVLVIGLPHDLGSGVVCPNCVIWPHPSAQGATGGQIALELLVAAPLTLAAIGLWAISALPLARDAWRWLRSRARGGGSAWDAAAGDSIWWGRAMMVIAAALTVLVYVASSESYRNPITASRYLVGMYACAPVVVAPLVAGAERVWRWLRSRRAPGGVAGRAPTGERLAPQHLVAAALLVAGFVVALGGLGATFATTADAESYGVPSGQRDATLIAFLQAHGATRFYAPYWTCYRIAFESEAEAPARFECSVVKDDDAFAAGQNRVTEFMNAVAGTAHPAYVLDPVQTSASATAVAQLAALQAHGDPRLAGYTSADVNGFVVYYYSA